MYGNTCTDGEGREWGDGREREREREREMTEN